MKDIIHTKNSQRPESGYSSQKEIETISLNSSFSDENSEIVSSSYIGTIISADSDFYGFQKVENGTIEPYKRLLCNLGEFYSHDLSVSDFAKSIKNKMNLALAKEGQYLSIEDKDKFYYLMNLYEKISVNCLTDPPYFFEIVKKLPDKNRPGFPSEKFLDSLYNDLTELREDKKNYLDITKEIYDKFLHQYSYLEEKMRASKEIANKYNEWVTIIEKNKLIKNEISNLYAIFFNKEIFLKENILSEPFAKCIKYQLLMKQCDKETTKLGITQKSIEQSYRDNKKEDFFSIDLENRNMYSYLKQKIKIVKEAPAVSELSIPRRAIEVENLILTACRMLEKVIELDNRDIKFNNKQKKNQKKLIDKIANLKKEVNSKFSYTQTCGNLSRIIKTNKRLLKSLNKTESLLIKFSRDYDHQTQSSWLRAECDKAFKTSKISILKIDKSSKNQFSKYRKPYSWFLLKFSILTFVSLAMLAIIMINSPVLFPIILFGIFPVLTSFLLSGTAILKDYCCHRTKVKDINNPEDNFIDREIAISNEYFRELERYGEWSPTINKKQINLKPIRMVESARISEEGNLVVGRTERSFFDIKQTNHSLVLSHFDRESVLNKESHYNYPRLLRSR